MNRTRHYGCRNIDRDRQQDDEPAVLLQCPRCDAFIRTIITEMLELSKKEYLRGLQDGARLQRDVQGLKGKEEA